MAYRSQLIGRKVIASIQRCDQFPAVFGQHIQTDVDSPNDHGELVRDRRPSVLGKAGVANDQTDCLLRIQAQNHIPQFPVGCRWIGPIDARQFAL